MQHFLETFTGSTTVGIGRTLDDCRAIAAMYDNTCDGESPVDMETHTGMQMSCTGQMMCPDGDGSVLYTEENPCTFTRKLCATCATGTSGEVEIRIQTNEMPNHCFQAINQNPTTTSIADFSVLFNRDVTGMQNISDTDVNTQAKTEEMICDISRT